MGGHSDYREACQNYKNSKREPIINEFERDRYPKKKKKKNKKQWKNHKHVYIPAIFYQKAEFLKAKNLLTMTGTYCKECGRVQNMRFNWSRDDERITRFREEYPDCREIYLPDSWNCFKDKCVPLE